MKVFHISPNKKAKLIEVTRKDLIAMFSIHTRDLRPVFLSKQLSTILVREKVLVINFGVLKLLVSKDQAFVFNADIKEVAENFLTSMTTKLFSSNKEHQSEQSASFEFKVLESVLSYKGDNLKEEFILVEKKITQLLKALEKDFNDANLEKLLTLKKRLTTLETKIQETEHALLEILEDDEIMSEMYLSHPQKNIELENQDIDEIESILESAFDPIEDLKNKVAEMKENINDTQEIITLKMSSVRNTIIRFDLIISVITAALAIPAIVVGFYGMNVALPHSTNMYASYFIFTGIILAIVVIFGGVWNFMKKKKII